MLKLNEPVIVGPTETKILTKIHLVFSVKTAKILFKGCACSNIC